MDAQYGEPAGEAHESRGYRYPGNKDLFQRDHRCFVRDGSRFILIVEVLARLTVAEAVTTLKKK